MDFEGLLESAALNGRAAVTVAEDALLFSAPGGSFACLYSDIRSFAAEAHVLVIDTAFGAVRLSQMGDALEWLYDKLWDAFNDAVQKALFVDGAPIYESRGAYRFADAGGTSEGTAAVRLFGNCVLILPPDENARRVPFCFVREVREENFSLSLTLDTGEAYTFLRLGGYQEGFAYQLEKAMSSFRQEVQQALGQIGAGVNSMQLSAIARLLPAGVAAPMGAVAAISRPFAGVLEQHIAESRAAAPYAFLKQACDPAAIWVGLKPCETRVGGESPETQPPGDLPGDMAGEPAYIVFIAAPAARERGVAAVELAIPEEDSAATYLYRCEGDWAAFAGKLNRAMEAVSFRREIIWMGEDALNAPEHAHYRMAIKRTEALRFLRTCFFGRVIHSSAEAWEQEMREIFG